jgi:hypothetical protein
MQLPDTITVHLFFMNGLQRMYCLRVASFFNKWAATNVLLKSCTNKWAATNVLLKSCTCIPHWNKRGPAMREGRPASSDLVAL